MARTQRNKATERHLGVLKAKLAKLRRELITPKGGSSGPGEGFDVAKTGDARVGFVGKTPRWSCRHIVCSFLSYSPLMSPVLCLSSSFPQGSPLSVSPLSSPIWPESTRRWPPTSSPPSPLCLGLSGTREPRYRSGAEGDSVALGLMVQCMYV